MKKISAEAQRAKDISDLYGEIVRMRQVINAKFIAIKSMAVLESENSGYEVEALRIEHDEDLGPSIRRQQDVWHNKAYDRGFFDVEPKQRKMSKSNG